MNKYFKGKSPGNKIYFKEDYIQEIAYFLNEKKTGEDVTEERKAGTEWFFVTLITLIGCTMIYLEKCCWLAK